MKKKIAITFPYVPFFSGGAELHVEQLRNNLNQRGFQAEIVSIPFKWYPEHELWEQMLMWRTTDLSETNGEKIDLLIGTKWPSYLARHENKVIWLIHQHREAYDLLDAGFSWFRIGGSARPFLQQFRDADSMALNEAKKIFTISKTVSARLEKFNGIKSEPLYHPPKHTGKYYCENYGDFILSVGRITELKRLDLLIQGMRFTDKHVKCYIAGTGPSAYTEALVQMANQYGLSDRIKFLGFISDEEMLKLYSECLCVYYAPVDEDYGYITLESFLSKKPVITAVDSGGVLEFAEHGVSAFVCEPAPEQIGAAINQLYLDKSKAKEFGCNGYENVKDISWEHALNQLLSYSGF